MWAIKCGSETNGKRSVAPHQSTMRGALLSARVCVVVSRFTQTSRTPFRTGMRCNGSRKGQGDEASSGRDPRTQFHFFSSEMEGLIHADTYKGARVHRVLRSVVSRSDRGFRIRG